MGQFTKWQSKEVDASVLGDNGKLESFRFKRVMLEYAEALMESGNEKEALKAIGANSFDLANWHGAYPSYYKYLELRVKAKSFSNGINADFVYGILGKAALGQISLNGAQAAAIRLIMQGKGYIAANGAQKKPSGVKATEFGVEEPD